MNESQTVLGTRFCAGRVRAFCGVGKAAGSLGRESPNVYNAAIRGRFLSSEK